MYVDKSRPSQRPDVATMQEVQYSIFNIIVYQRGCRMGWCIWTAWGDYPVSILRMPLLLLPILFYNIIVDVFFRISLTCNSSVST